MYGYQNSEFYLHSVNKLVFVNEVEYIYCAVPFGYLNVMQVNLNL